MSGNTRFEGISGEVAAGDFLEKNGYDILERNYRTKFAEADIIAEKDGILVFVEVKSRENLKYGYPVEAITPSKIRGYYRLAEFYIMKNRLAGRQVRFDVVSVLRGQIEHIENAF